MSAQEIGLTGSPEQVIAAAAKTILRLLETPPAVINKLEGIGYAAAVIGYWSSMPQLEGNQRRDVSSVDRTVEEGTAAPAEIAPEYRAGAEEAKRQLIGWRDDKKISASQMAAEWTNEIGKGGGQRRQGMTDAMVAYLWGLMHLGEPVLEAWEPLEDLRAESFHLEEA
jgi:hypothetical protein